MSGLPGGLHAELEARGYRVFDLGAAGLGVEFRDGCDAWWVLPGDPLSSVEVASGGASEVASIVGAFERLDGLRTRAIHAVRHHLARRRMRVHRARHGTWPIWTENGRVSSEVAVGAALTAELGRSGEVVGAVREVFRSSIARMPAARRVRLDLEAAGEPADELAWADDGADVEARTSPMAVLQIMGICRAIESLARPAQEGQLPAIEEVAAGLVGGRIARALGVFAAALPDAFASLELTDGSMTVRFGDGLDDFRIRPKSRDLARTVRRDGPEAAGGLLVAEYRRLEADRARVIAAIRAGLPRLGYRVQDEGSTLHYGRAAREGSVALGRPLTEALRHGPASEAVRVLLAAHPTLAEALVDAIPAESPGVLPAASPLMLRPARPDAIVLPALPRSEAGELDRIARSVIAGWFEHRQVLDAYDDPLWHDRRADRWADRDDWIAAARRSRVGDYGDGRAELLRVELGDTTDEAAWFQRLRSAGWHGENSAAEIAAVYRYRRRMPEVAREWLTPRAFEDCPGAEARASEGDWIASRYLAASMDPGEEPPWRTIATLTPSALRVFAGPELVRRWQARARELVEQTWDWAYADDDPLKAAAVHGWREVGEALAGNPYLAKALHDGSAWPHGAATALLAWSRLAPSEGLARLVGGLLVRDLGPRMDEAARRMVGSKVEGQGPLVRQFADLLAAELRRALAVAWTRCRSRVEGTD